MEGIDMAKRPFDKWYFFKTSETISLRDGKHITTHGRQQEKYPEQRGIDVIGTVQAEGILVSPQGDAWPVRSGPHNRGDIPEGEWIISSPVRKTQQAFSDSMGNGWFAHLTNPSIERQTGRDQFGIHPDGALPGTSGCVGIRVRGDTRPIRDALSRTPSVQRKLKVMRITEEKLQELYLEAQGF
jgi:hypothetical protein